MEDTKTVPEKDTTVAPDSGESGNAHKNTEAPKFKYKSQEEAERAHAELEKKLGEQSSEVEKARKAIEQNEVLLRAVWSDPDTYRTVEEAIRKYQNGEMPEDTKNSKDQKDKKLGDEDAKGTEVDPTVKDLRVAQENQILEKFYTTFGYKDLDENGRRESQRRLVTALAEIADPGGKKPIRQILSEIPLTKLSKFLESAHFIANKDQIIDKAKRSAFINKGENDAASIGSFSSNSGRQEKAVTLTNQEKEVARKMGVPEEKYLQRKIQVEKESSRFS